MRWAVLAVVVLAGAAAGISRPKRTIGVIFRGLVDANQRATPAPQKGQKGQKTEKVQAPPPATVYIIPVPDRDKNIIFSNITSLPAPPRISANYIQLPLVNSAQNKKNTSTSEPKQYLIRITGEDGKAILLRITGEDIKVKKNNKGYSIGVSNNNAAANINIELPQKKKEASKSDNIRTNVVNDYPLYAGFSPSSAEKLPYYQKLPYPDPRFPFSHFPAYPYPVFLTPPYLQPYSMESRHHPQHVDHNSTVQTLEGYATTHRPEIVEEEKPKDQVEQLDKALTFTLRVKNTLESPKNTLEQAGKTNIEDSLDGYHYPAPNKQSDPPKYQQQPQQEQQPHYQQTQHVQPQHQLPQHQPQYHQANYQQVQYQPQQPQQQNQVGYQLPQYLPQYQWYLQPPQPNQQTAATQQQATPAPQPANSWNYAHFTPFPSYLQDTLAPPYLSNGYGRAAPYQAGK